MASGDHPDAIDLLTSAESVSVAGDQQYALMRQVLASRTFAKSNRLSSFLEFVCTRAIERKTDQINEQQIGIHVFGRSASYNPADDSVVRSQARLLRQRLEEYFEHECPSCPMRIIIPKGGYVPVFELVGAPAAVPPALQSALESKGTSIGAEGVTAVSPALPHDESARSAARPGFWKSKTWRGLRPLVMAVVLLLAGLGAWTSYRWVAPREESRAQQLLWKSIFDGNKPVVIVPSDDALVLFQELTKKPVGLDAYISGAYLDTELPSSSTKLGSAWFTSHQYTSTADLNLAMRLGRLPEAADANVLTRNARVIHIDEMKSSNVVLIGGLAANPWVGLFASQLNFVVDYDWQTSQGYVRNKHPAAGEKATYSEAYQDGSRHSYGVLAYLPGLAGDNRTLLFEGTGMAGTESAADFPFNKGLFQAFTDRIGGNASHLPYFEALLETTDVGGNAPEARVISYRIIQP